MRTKKITQDSKKSPLPPQVVKILEDLAVQEEKSLTLPGVSLYGDLNLREIIKVRQIEGELHLQLFEPSEPVKNGFWSLKTTLYQKPLCADIADGASRGHMRHTDIKQGRNGNCWFLAAIGSVLIMPKENGSKFISRMMRDLSQPVVLDFNLTTEEISLASSQKPVEVSETQKKNVH
jgi:hypothetical protein